MSAEPKLSAWLPGTWKPTLPGVYERDYRGVNIPVALINACLYCRWDGRFWYSCAETVQDAADKAWTAHEQTLPWRGLAEPPR